jgi:hypothetical protein
MRLLRLTFVVVVKREVLNILSVVCILVLATRHSKLMHLLNGHLWPVRLYHTFALYCINLKIFGKHLLSLQYVFWFSLQNASQEFLILRRPEGDTIINIIDCHVKCPLFLWDFNETRIFPNDYWKIFKCHISRKLVQWEPSCSMITEGRMEDGQTDRETRRN